MYRLAGYPSLSPSRTILDVCIGFITYARRKRQKFDDALLGAGSVRKPPWKFDLECNCSGVSGELSVARPR